MGGRDSNTVIGDLNSPLLSVSKSSRQKINKEALALNYKLDKIDLTDTYGTSYPKANVYPNTHSSQVHLEHSQGSYVRHKTNLNMCKKI